MKLLICVTLAALLAVSQAQITIYTPWGQCSPTATPGVCTQSRSPAACAPIGSPICAGVGSLINLLTCQSCVNATAGCGADSIPTNWQGIYTVNAARCNPNPSPNPANPSLACCCMPAGASVFVRQYDELVEMTFLEGTTMSGNGCNVPAAAGTSIPEAARFFPKGVSFKVVDPRITVGGVPINAGTYVNGGLVKSAFTDPSGIPGTNMPDTIASAGTVTLFGRSYRAILTCGSIYFFGWNAFSASGDNPLCVQQLTKVSDLASY